MKFLDLENKVLVYFDDSIKVGEVAFAKLLPEEERSGLDETLVRSWAAVRL